MARHRVEPIGNVIAEIISRRGIAASRSAEACQAAWRQAVGSDLAEFTRCGEVRRKRLEVRVASSIVIQELTFQKQEILARLNEAMPELGVTDLRFRVGEI